MTSEALRHADRHDFGSWLLVRVELQPNWPDPLIV